MTFMSTLYQMGHEDFHYKRFFIESMALLIQERYEKTFSHPAWQARKGLYGDGYLSNITCCWNSGSCLLHNKYIILVEHSVHFYIKCISVHQSTKPRKLIPRFSVQRNGWLVSTHNMDTESKTWFGCTF